MQFNTHGVVQPLESFCEQVVVDLVELETHPIQVLRVEQQELCELQVVGADGKTAPQELQMPIFNDLKRVLIIVFLGFIVIILFLEANLDNIDEAKFGARRYFKVFSVREPRQHKVALALLQHVHFGHLVALIVYELAWCGHKGLEQRTNPRDKALALALQEGNFLADALVNVERQVLAEVVRQVLHKIANLLRVLYVVKSQILLDFAEEFNRELVFVEQTVQDCQLFFVYGVVAVLERHVACKGATRKTKAHDTKEHDEDAEELLYKSARAEVSVADRRDRGHREVERGQVLVSLIHPLNISRHPRIFVAFVEGTDYDPHAAKNVSVQCKIEHEQHDALEGNVNSCLLVSIALDLA